MCFLSARNLGSIKVYIAILIAILLFSCKRTPEEVHSTFDVSKRYVVIGDSLSLLANGSENFSITPNAGIVRNGYYVAPSSIINDSFNITITLNSVQPINKTVTVIRGGKPDSTIQFKRDVLTLFNANCNFTACHGNGYSAGKVNLETYSNVMKSVTRYQPQNSIVYLSLFKPDALRRMPPAGPLNAVKKRVLEQWILQGATEN